MDGRPTGFLVCCGERLGVEVGTRWKDDVHALHDGLEARLSAEGRDVDVHLVFSGKPLAIGERTVHDVVDQIAAAVTSLDDRASLHIDSPGLRVDLTPRASGEGVTVVYGTGFELCDHMAEAEREVANLLARKQHQAASMDTILLVDISRIGQSWLRPPAVWKQQLRQLLASAGTFVGVGVFLAPIDRIDLSGAMAIRPDVSEATKETCGRLTTALNLELD